MVTSHDTELSRWLHSSVDWLTDCHRLSQSETEKAAIEKFDSATGQLFQLARAAPHCLGAWQFIPASGDWRLFTTVDRLQGTYCVAIFRASPGNRNGRLEINIEFLAHLEFKSDDDAWAIVAGSLKKLLRTGLPIDWQSLLIR